MSCFWDSLVRALTNEELKLLMVRRNTPDVIKSIKLVNQLTPDVLWQGRRLTAKEQKENFEHVKNYDEKTYRRGYLTSSGDPFLILFSQLYAWNIEFKYQNIPISITHRFPLRKVRFSASRSHFENA